MQNAPGLEASAHRSGDSACFQQKQNFIDAPQHGFRPSTAVAKRSSDR